jgi:hypothetical protein
MAAAVFSRVCVRQAGPCRRDILISGSDTVNDGIVNPHHADLGTLAENQGGREGDPGLSDLGNRWLQFRGALAVRMKCSGPGFQSCERPLPIPHVILNGI